MVSIEKTLTIKERKNLILVKLYLKYVCLSVKNRIMMFVYIKVWFFINIFNI